ncbi:TonB-dependent receptor [Novosphingobium sp. Rr 2-17]|uniref:TonB-dependent receptor n=1 Tax=Novosphingobium sp. Rr 2-17 TaxID=555793 RepID=UPI00026984FF|nr:TonB-dependent receptor [Novosphingobium sp. Rr 2-17]EIZ79433.1 TonB-dependent receptor [Novosphingobium sp. Rr 2-17]
MLDMINARSFKAASRAVSASALAAGLSTGAYAQSTEQPSTPNEIVVTADKREEKLTQVAAGISVVTASQLDNLHAASVADYLQFLPGVSLQSNGTAGRETISIRGVSPQGSGATTVTYIDEIAVGSASVLAEPSTYAIDINPADVQQIEVLKGPQGTLYGASSMGGVIKYVLKKPNLTRATADVSEEFSFPQGGTPSTNFRASASAPLVNDSLGLRVSGYYRGIGGWVDNIVDGAKDINNGHDRGVRAVLFWKPSDIVDFTLSALHQDSHANGFDSLDVDYSTGKHHWQGNEVARYAPETYDQTTSLITLETNVYTNIGAIVSASSFSRTNNQDTRDYTYLWEDYGLANADNDPGFYSGTHHTEKYTQELRFTSNRLGPFDFIVGGYFDREDVARTAFYGYYDRDAKGGEGQSLGIVDSASKLTEWAGFANATAHISRSLDVTAGIRHSQITQTFNAANSGLLFTGSDDVEENTQHFRENKNTYMGNIRWRPTDNILFYARVASGYRPGGGRTIPIGAPDGLADHYESDSLWNYEVGTKVSLLNNHLTIDADLFWIDWTNIQTYVTYGNVSVNGNGGKAVSKGAEAQITFQPIDGLNLSANGTYNKAYFTESTDSFSAGERIPNIPKFTWTVSASYDLAISDRWRATLGGDIGRRSTQIDSYLENYPGYTTANAYVNVHKGGTLFSIFIHNATNSTGYTGTQLEYSLIPLKTYSVTPPRTFGISASQHF